ncbi:hypothetical protein HBI56_230830 [Parastagonospora nodorum]|uniref:Uncharacterized protein n=2 Tax=Phaeosphaeria nodorum (strain SN15 / ATCC MYA-4574 / FGSC 10173) TaxID=321614 RepID=A0A7U2I5P5_PHANO|nr:hypothetical protein SNOG_16133 [Parastagonospora nodorum SN15]KAH3905093.1 hypothetical protein HBH56_223770 [Parastagonospora nodorum]EAT76505.1 hypothetical protein SNOG_16133 [Parastagonospora nodorum SN15]KAH3921929.1 hypothetical protein HBH54_231920 [Parastagonospora nodorum]KAH3991747.1 hypothetical protein HBI10_228190 [Parastagonospora nodorum]KAH4008790.1 hypothetical protein HBI13_229710 [Parastagonospora nodorum]
MSSQITSGIALRIAGATTLAYATTFLGIALYNRHAATPTSPIEALQSKVDILFPDLAARVTVKRIMTTRMEYWFAEMRDGEGGVLERSPMCRSEGQAVGELERLIRFGGGGVQELDGAEDRLCCGHRESSECVNQYYECIVLAGPLPENDVKIWTAYMCETIDGQNFIVRPHRCIGAKTRQWISCGP